MFTPTKEELVISVTDSFWAYFFGSKLVIRFVGGSVTFCVSCPEGRTQLFFVYNELGSSSLPSARELAAVFPCDHSGTNLDDVRSLPIPLKAIRNIRGVYLRKAELADGRRVVALYPTWEKPSRLKFSVGVLNAADFNLPASEMRQVADKSPDHEVLLKQFVTIRNFGFIRIFTILRRSSVVRLSDKITLACRKDGQLDAEVQQLN